MSSKGAPLTREIIQGKVDSIKSKLDLDKKENGRINIALRALELLLKSEGSVSWEVMKRRTGSMYANQVKHVLDELEGSNLIVVNDSGYASRGSHQRTTRLAIRNYTLTESGMELAAYVSERLKLLS